MAATLQADITRQGNDDLVLMAISKIGQMSPGYVRPDGRIRHLKHVYIVLVIHYKPINDTTNIRVVAERIYQS